jgi:integrase
MLDKGRGATTVLRSPRALSGILSDAVKAKRIAVNPAKGVENLPRKTARRRVYLSADDVHRLADESGEHRALILLLAYCGLRWGEAIALRFRDAEFLGRRLTVSTNADQLGVHHAVGRTKSRQDRTVPFRSSFWPSYLCFVRDGRTMTWCFRGLTAATSRGRTRSGDGFAGAVKRAAVQSITPHDLRHTCASLAVSAGVNVLALQRILGQKSAKVTLDTFADLFDDDLDAVAVTLHTRYSRENAAKMRPKVAS